MKRPMRCQAVLLALSGSLALALRPPVRQSRTAPAEVTNENLVQLPVVAANSSRQGLSNSTRPLEKMASRNSSSSSDQAASSFPLPPVQGNWFAFSQTTNSAKFQLWMWETFFSRTTLWWIIIAETLILVLTTGGPLLLWAGTRVLGNTIQAGIEHFDKAILGVDVEIGRIHPDLLYGILDVEHLEVKNPEGKGYQSDYLLKANRIVIDIDMLRLFMSAFKHVKVEKIIFQNVDVIFEKQWASSNIKDVLDFVSKDAQKAREQKDLESQEQKKEMKDDSAVTPRSKTAAAANSRSSSAPPAVRKAPPADENKQVALSVPQKAPAKEESSLDVTLHEVLIEDVGARAQAAMLGGRGFRLSIADIRYRDFNEEMGASMLDEIVVILLKTVLKTVLSNIIGKRLGDQCM